MDEDMTDTALPAQRFLHELLETGRWTRRTPICPCRVFFFLLVLGKGIYFSFFSQAIDRRYTSEFTALAMLGIMPKHLGK